ncbi:unnamed protein product [Cylicostephanus goldi]|uniref:Uncharacterized protein n=1 Tax=Cylicostephanus goldi TaxID=71465 RepID=A0A3P6QLV3_CYLGO|nr:unnamed protein product [Cylicostephanus goldi]
MFSGQIGQGVDMAALIIQMGRDHDIVVLMKSSHLHP